MNKVVTTKTVVLEDLIANEVNPTYPNKIYMSLVQLLHVRESIKRGKVVGQILSGVT